VHLGELPDYIGAHQNAAEAFLDSARWTRMSLMNISRIGPFSSDRAVREYARDIWKIEPCPSAEIDL
jgi:starch phosphorylase